MSKAGRRRRDRVRSVARDRERESQVRPRDAVPKTWHIQDDHGCWRCWVGTEGRVKMIYDHEPLAWGRSFYVGPHPDDDCSITGPHRHPRAFERAARQEFRGLMSDLQGDYNRVIWGEGWGTALSWYESFPDMVRRHRPDWARRLWHWLRIPCPLPGCEYRR